MLDAIELAHPDWHPILRAGLHAVDQTEPAYLKALVRDDYLPDNGRIFAAFSQPIDAVSHVLVGEGPYPRQESATGFCFMDGAVDELWSASGLSKKVNRATSLRNFMKMLLVADGKLSAAQTNGEAMHAIAIETQSGHSDMIETLAALQDNLHRHGFLLLNATLVYRQNVPPVRESRAWRPFLQAVLRAFEAHARQHGKPLPKLVLWGKIAERLADMPEAARFPQVISEHPYNLSFIANPAMQALFGPMRLLQKTA